MKCIYLTGREVSNKQTNKRLHLLIFAAAAATVVVQRVNRNECASYPRLKNGVRFACRHDYVSMACTCVELSRIECNPFFDGGDSLKFIELLFSMSPKFNIEFIHIWHTGFSSFDFLLFSQQTNSLSNFHAFRNMKYNARAWFNSLWKIRLPSRSDSTTVSAVRVKVSICPAHFVFIPFHQNEIVIAIGLCAQRTHITHALILRLRLFTGCTLHLLFVCKAQFNGLVYAVYAICMQTSVAHRFIKWVRK